jgi:hypothetical protein
VAKGENMNRQVSKSVFGVPSLETARKIDDDDKVNMLSSASYEYEASARDLALAYEAQLEKLSRRYLDRVISTHGEE